MTDSLGLMFARFCNSPESAKKAPGSNNEHPQDPSELSRRYRSKPTLTFRVSPDDQDGFIRGPAASSEKSHDALSDFGCREGVTSRRHRRAARFCTVARRDARDSEAQLMAKPNGLHVAQVIEHHRQWAALPPASAKLSSRTTMAVSQQRSNLVGSQIQNRLAIKQTLDPRERTVAG
ncbi:hypothetical protein BC567DRAFT_207790 [Phyllosticta citribraziliensis]